MAKATTSFEDFLSEVSPDYKSFAEEINDSLLANGCQSKIEQKASGYFVSYADLKTKRSLMNFLFRKSGLIARIYGENCKSYSEFLNSIPSAMGQEISKATDCKRLIDPSKCNQKCTMGYEFEVGNNHYQKCKNSCFMFLITQESMPIVADFVKYELEARQ